MALAPKQDPELPSRLKKSNEELKELQNSVKTGMIDVKVLMDFRTASERARQASVSVQRWLESQGKGNDPYQLMTEVMRKRTQRSARSPSGSPSYSLTDVVANSRRDFCTDSRSLQSSDGAMDGWRNSSARTQTGLGYLGTLLLCVLSYAQ